MGSNTSYVRHTNPGAAGYESSIDAVTNFSAVVDFSGSNASKLSAVEGEVNGQKIMRAFLK